MDWLIGKTRRKDKEVADENSRIYLKQDFTRERLDVPVDLRALVTLPAQVDHNEWLASNTKSFFEHINSISGCLTEFCRLTTCPTMTGPGNQQYHWIDDRGKKCKCSAPQYTDFVMSFSQKCISDESVFPTKYGNKFPNSFEKVVRKINRLLLHVIAHIYWCHSRDLLALQLRSHLNTVTLQFLLFNRHFGLIEDKEIDVLGDLFQRLQFPPRCEALAPNGDAAASHGVAASPYLFDPKMISHKHVTGAASFAQHMSGPSSTRPVSGPAAASALRISGKASSQLELYPNSMNPFVASLKRSTVRPKGFAENESNGFTSRDGLTPCALVT